MRIYSGLAMLFWLVADVAVTVGVVVAWLVESRDLANFLGGAWFASTVLYAMGYWKPDNVVLTEASSGGEQPTT